MSEETPYKRRNSDVMLIRLDGKVDNVLEDLKELKAWMVSHERRINDCEKQHVRIKTIVGIAGGALTLVWTGILYIATRWGEGH